MPLFEVKGWDVPSQTGIVASGSQSSKKRKRPAKDAGKVQSAIVNVEKLMRQVEKRDIQSQNGQSKERRNRERAQVTRATGIHISDDLRTKSPGKNPRVKRIQTKSHTGELRSSDKDSLHTINPPPSKRLKRKALGTQSPSRFSSDGVPSTDNKKMLCQPKESSSGLTSLQAHMKGSLDGARFRWINEVLYTSGSADGRKLMQDDPKHFQEYHAGFRQQVRNWPSNPVKHYISVLSSYPRGTVIVDLGCGDATLARTLVPRGYCVLSFDLVSDGAYVLEADVCQRIPLPGMEDSADDSPGQVADVCVCALSLMSLDWMSCIRETWRILRLGGELKIAEVTSRFTDFSKFIAVITDLGFKFKAKDDSNTHFTLFDFEKIPRPPLSLKRWNELQAQRDVLQPCEYKRR